MKHLPALLLSLLLLTGCAHSPAPVDPPVQTVQALYDPVSPMEQQTNGAVRTYPLPMEEVCGFRAFGTDLLIFSGTEETTLTLLTGEALHPLASARLDFVLDPEAPRIFDDSLSFYDPVRKETLVLDKSLTEIRRIAAPQDMTGAPILSRDGNTLYYCTTDALRAWDLPSGLRRLVRSEAGVRLAELHRDDRILQCTAGERSLLIDPKDGRLLWEGDKAFYLTTRAGRYYASLPAGQNPLLLFGRDAPQALTTADFNSGICFFLKNQNAAVIAIAEPETVLSCYDLDTGLRISSLSLNTRDRVQVEDTADGTIYVLSTDEFYGGKVLYRWAPTLLPTKDTTVYTAPYFSANAPDAEGLARCRAYADEIGSRYGLRVLIGEEAAKRQPWDYDFEPEYVVPFLQQELELLDRSLANFPQQVLDDTMAHFSSLTICLVRQITGTAESGSLDAANGLQFFDGTDVYLALAVGPNSDHPLYHELFHVMETHLLGGSTAFDRWDNMNPADFSYRYGYDAAGEYDAYLQGENRAFIDSYSMSFPKEDRARIMEYAMTPDHEELFSHKILQAKLAVLCQGLRQAYGLKKSPETFLWEQYLHTPLAYEGK